MHHSLHHHLNQSLNHSHNNTHRQKLQTQPLYEYEYQYQYRKQYSNIFQERQNQEYWRICKKSVPKISTFVRNSQGDGLLCGDLGDGSMERFKERVKGRGIYEEKLGVIQGKIGNQRLNGLGQQSKAKISINILNNTMPNIKNNTSTISSNKNSLVQPPHTSQSSQPPSPQIKINLQTLQSQSCSYTFKYIINLGDDRYGSMTINQKTNLYLQAQNFCKRYGLDSYVAVFLEREMFEEVMRVTDGIRGGGGGNGNQNYGRKDQEENIYMTSSISKNNSKQKDKIGKITRNKSSQKLITSTSRQRLTQKQRQKQKQKQALKSININNCSTSTSQNATKTVRLYNTRCTLPQKNITDINIISKDSRKSKSKSKSKEKSFTNNYKTNNVIKQKQNKKQNVDQTYIQTPNKPHKTAINSNINSISISKSGRKSATKYTIVPPSTTTSTTTSRTTTTRHFEQMFKRHQQIEQRKQLKRKASLQKMSFRPVINSLSRKIVDFKRGYKKYDSNMGSNMGNTEDDYHTNTTLIGTSGNNNMQAQKLQRQNVNPLCKSTEPNIDVNVNVDMNKDKDMQKEKIIINNI